MHPLPLDEGETVEITVARSRPAVPPASPDEAKRRIREAGTLPEWVEAANAVPPAEDSYDLLQAVNENRHPSERPLVPPVAEAENR